MLVNFARRAPQGILSLFSQRTSAAAMTSAANSQIFQTKSPMPASSAVSALGGVRHSGASAIACGLATIALSGVASGVGSVFAALVVGTARNPAVKDQLFTYTMIGYAMVEVVMVAAIIFAGILLTSD